MQICIAFSRQRHAISGTKAALDESGNALAKMGERVLLYQDAGYVVLACRRRNRK